MSKIDPAVIHMTSKYTSKVDDFIWGGTQSFTTTVIPLLRSMFQVGREENDNFCYVGINFENMNKKVQIPQKS